MKDWTTRKLAALVLATALLPAGARAHPGHEHSGDALAYLVHSVTAWGPLLIVLVLGAVVGLRWRNTRRR
jgi:hypothetical protein